MLDPTPAGFTLFDTAIGRCGIAWSARGVTRIALPETREVATRQRLVRDTPGLAECPPPPVIARAIALIVQHVAGAPAALETIELDMDGVPEFYREVYAEARRIPSGRTVSYGALAAALGKPGAARAIGQAMGKNPFPIVMPCHRVLAANHATGGFSAPGGVTTKAKLLAAEGFTLAVQPELPFTAAPRRA
ncbi:MAG TPA: methylated-DNA--[protein]-cysteine S-methyltransferase [Kofleriaceae bacterium]|jgi:methylated-DNA-[protein]-cysteine S-methyltransferase|nr:methylated-DNA--[protein]-cysteine S-methyltransferase [Kofleriaceae bacterium]